MALFNHIEFFRDPPSGPVSPLRNTLRVQLGIFIAQIVLSDAQYPMTIVLVLAFQPRILRGKRRLILHLPATSFREPLQLDRAARISRWVYTQSHLTKDLSEPRFRLRQMNLLPLAQMRCPGRHLR